MKRAQSVVPVVAGFALAFISTLAHAQLFAGASLGQSNWREFHCPGADAATNVTQCDSHGTAGTVRFGYRYTPWFAVEGRYFDLGKATDTTEGQASDSNVGPQTIVSRSRFSAKGLGLDAVLSWPVSDRFALSGLVGVARSEANAHFSTEMIPNDPLLTVPDVDGTKRSTNPYYGVALDFAVTPQLWLSVEADRYRIGLFGADTDIDLVAGGITYRFR